MARIEQKSNKHQASSCFIMIGIGTVNTFICTDDEIVNKITKHKKMI
jgi:hypothetical protein